VNALPPAEALVKCEALSREAPGNPEAAEGICWLSMILERGPQAEAACRRACDLMPNNIEVRTAQGCLALREGDCARALGEFDEALAINPEYSVPAFNRCIALRQCGRPQDADGCLEAAKRLASAQGLRPMLCPGVEAPR